jgi:hypothetical protein
MEKDVTEMWGNDKHPASSRARVFDDQHLRSHKTDRLAPSRNHAYAGVGRPFETERLHSLVLSCIVNHWYRALSESGRQLRRDTHVVPQSPAVKQVMIDPERTAWRSGMESGFSLSRFWASYNALPF